VDEIITPAYRQESGEIWSDLSLMLFSPSRFFMPGNLDSAARPGLFVFVTIFCSMVVFRLWQLGFRMLSHPDSAAPGFAALPLTKFLLIPLLSALAAFLIVRFVTLPFHLGLILTGSGKGGIGRTYRVFCYATAAALFLFIPLVGPLAAPVWGAVLLLLGMKTAHHTGTVRVLLSAVISFLVIGMGLVLGAVILILVISLALGYLFGAGF
jgi:hypothetical protein